MKEKLNALLQEGREKILAAKNETELQDIKAAILGKQGGLTALLKEVPKLDVALRPEMGKAVNQAKAQLTELIEQHRNDLKLKASQIDADFDISVPGFLPPAGGLHPITQMCYDLNDAFRSMGFEIYEEDDITSELYGFDNLNARHERAFFQYEALIVDKDFTFASGKVMIQSILSKVFGREVPVRMRAGFFPFVEPGFEIDMGCLVCGGKGCSVCKQVGWIEIMPGGTPHPNVLRAAGLDPDEYTGFYVNIGLDRLVMMRYGVDDVRLFHSADLRFLKQFH